MSNISANKFSTASTLNSLRAELKKVADTRRAAVSARFFKTGKGQYGYGDIFLGIPVPIQRKIAKKYTSLGFTDIKTLMQSRLHEERLVGLYILISHYENEDTQGKKRIVDFYIKNLACVNNWDLVDTSAPKILGDYLLTHPKERTLLYEFARSKNIWIRRVAILSTFTFIRAKQFADTLHIAKILLNDPHDLIHKAVGWMLREVGNKDRTAEEKFLKKHYQKMPRTSLRYAIEKFPPSLRQFYMEKSA